MKETEQKKKYKKPKIVFEKKIEILAAVCDSAWVPAGQCRQSPGGCDWVRD